MEWSNREIEKKTSLTNSDGEQKPQGKLMYVCLAFFRIVVVQNDAKHDH